MGQMNAEPHDPSSSRRRRNTPRAGRRMTIPLPKSPPQDRNRARGEHAMTLRLANLLAFAICATVSALPLCPAAKAADAQSDIKALEDRFIAAFKAKDLDAIMKSYIP